MNRYEQAVSGLDIQTAGGVVRVSDGHCIWLCDESEWDSVAGLMQTLPAMDDDDTDEAEAYGQLCRAIRGAVANTDGGGTQGTDDEQAALVARADAAGLDVSGLE